MARPLFMRSRRGECFLLTPAGGSRILNPSHFQTCPVPKRFFREGFPMKRTLLICSIVSLVASLLLEAPAQAADGFTPIFDGKSLQGWKGKSGLWSVKDGAIVGSTGAAGCRVAAPEKSCAFSCHGCARHRAQATCALRGKKNRDKTVWRSNRACAGRSESACGGERPAGDLKPEHRRGFRGFSRTTAKKETIKKKFTDAGATVEVK